MSSINYSRKLAIENREKVFEFLAKNQDQLYFAKKGYIEQLRSQYKNESGLDIDFKTFQRWIRVYRTKYDVKIHYVNDPWYTPTPGPFSNYSAKD